MTTSDKMMLFVLVTNLLTSTGNFGLEIVLNNPEYITQCVKDLRNGTDTYVLVGSYDSNVTELERASSNNTVSLQILTINALTFIDICKLLFGPTGWLCTPYSAKSCNCDSVDVHDTAHIRIITSAFVSHSAGILRGVWQQNNEPYNHTENVTLPHIYDVKRANLQLKMNNNPVVMTSQFCDLSFTSPVNNTIELCCSNTASPCYPRMSFSDGVIIDSQATCVNRTFKCVKENYTVNMIASYSVCTLYDYITRYSCLIKTNVKKASLQLKLNNNPIVMTSQFCDISLTSHEDNTIEVCCSNTASPCYPRISFSDGVIIDSQATCVNRTFKCVKENYTVNMIASYSVCTLYDYITRYSCQIKTILPKATVQLKVNNKPIAMTDSSCESSFTSDKDNTVELCCRDTSSPCYPRMTFSDGVVVDNQTTCVSRTIKSASESFTWNVIASYSLCTLTDSITGYSCRLESKSPYNSENNALVVGFIFGIVFIVFIMDMLVIVLAKRRAPEQTHTKATSAEVSTHDLPNAEQIWEREMLFTEVSCPYKKPSDAARKTRSRPLEMVSSVLNISLNLPLTNKQVRNN